jgi:hypothetical protein
MSAVQPRSLARKRNNRHDFITHFLSLGLKLFMRRLVIVFYFLSLEGDAHLLFWR